MMRDPYDTTLLRGHPVKQLRNALEEEAIKGLLMPHLDDQGQPSSILFEVAPGDSVVPPMVAPMLFSHRSEECVAYDTRASKRRGRDGSVTIAIPSDYRFQKLNAGLTYAWAVKGPGAFAQLGLIPIKAYSQWMSESVVRRLGLDPLTQVNLRILAAYYYLAQLAGGDVPVEHRIGSTSVISRALSVAPSAASALISQQGPMQSVLDLVKAYQAFGGSERMEVFNVGVLYTLLGPSWYGANSRPTVGVAIEYLPTFLAMLYTAYTDRSYHKSFFAKTAEGADRREHGRDYCLAVDAVLRGIVHV